MESEIESVCGKMLELLRVRKSCVSLMAWKK